ncbi:glycosyltransferase [Salmonella enterica]|uniref:Glycosyltransferase n=1 Tax=Salmonella enterica TaxID=28901 RepID=U3GK21_SALER|nr:glycosyltransferase [Salmonella enterica]EEP9808744.1 glycosyltransferase [Salmonella enterica subsp. diarizonae]HAU3359783.1 glycosyltransferase [Salmonella enterica subsp. salamae]HCM1888713.1 glycosyltransferase [Salmonella enterica subsp. diarizonae serovar 57:c:z]AFW04885.1 glycosyltransferase [Salmonella enterica]ASO10009.1 alpha-L-Rha alpha-1,3-L-rhamnosyltransferase [Salmonella enterica subsp. salamae serovar 57:z29:z42]
MISVCIPTYNGEYYIEEQIDSILSEIGPDDEIIISDDGSTDSTLSIIEEYKDPRIKVYKNSIKNINYFKDRTEILLKKVSLNVQNTLMHCQGDYIYLADQDDIWIKGRIAKTISFLNTNSPTLVVCNCSVIDEDRNVTQDSYFDYISPSSNIFRTMVKSSFHGCCMCFNRSLLDKLFPFPEYSIGHDLWIGLQAMKFKGVLFYSEPLLLYRRHSSTVTMTGNKSSNTLNFKIKYRLMMLKEYLRIDKKR